MLQRHRAAKHRVLQPLQLTERRENRRRHKRINLLKAIIAANRRLTALPMPQASSSPVADAVGTILASAGFVAAPAKVADWIMIFLTIAIEFGAVAGPALAFDSPRKPVPTAQHATATRREVGWIEDLKRAAASPSFAKLNYNEDGTIAATYRCTAKAWNVSSIATVKKLAGATGNRGLYRENVEHARADHQDLEGNMKGNTSRQSKRGMPDHHPGSKSSSFLDFRQALLEEPAAQCLARRQ